MSVSRLLEALKAATAALRPCAALAEHCEKRNLRERKKWNYDL